MQFAWVYRPEHVRPLAFLPLLELVTNLPLQAIDTIVGSRTLVNLLFPPHPILLANVGEKGRRNKKFQLLLKLPLGFGYAQRLLNTTAQRINSKEHQSSEN